MARELWRFRRGSWGRGPGEVDAAGFEEEFDGSFKIPL